ncbi:MAG: tetratricopeptide repeat protein [Bacteroidota bacterium]
MSILLTRFGKLLLIIFHKFPNYYLLFGFLFLMACQDTSTLYQKTFTAEEKKQLALQMRQGIGYYYQGSVPEVMLIEEGLSLDPDNVELNREVGIPYLKRGFAAEFEKYYQRTISLDPTEWIGWRGYLYLYFYRDYERAIADFDATDSLTVDFVDYPQATSVHFMRAIAYLKLKKYDEALLYLDMHLTEELKTTTLDYIDAKTFLYQALAYYKQGALAKAREYLKIGTDNAPYSADLWYWTAKIALEQGQQEIAREALEKGQTQFRKGYQNQRPYVEEFFQLYQSDFDELQAQLK